MVIAILAIVSAVAVPKIVVMVDDAKEAKFYASLHNLKIAALTVGNDDPRFGNGTSNSFSAGARKKAAEEIATVLGLEAKQHTSSQDYYIPSIEIPDSPKWSFRIDNIETQAGKEYRLVLHIESLDKKTDIGDRIGMIMGLGKPTHNRNDLIYWTGSSVNKDHLNIVLHNYPPL